MWGNDFFPARKTCLIRKKQGGLTSRAGHSPYQVFVGQPGDLVLQAGLDAGLWGQLQVLGQQLLLPVVLFLQALDLPAQGLCLILMAPLLGLQLGFQKPAEKPCRQERVMTFKSLSGECEALCSLARAGK